METCTTFAIALSILTGSAELGQPPGFPSQGRSVAGSGYTLFGLKRILGCFIRNGSQMRILCIQLSFHEEYRDAGALASTYNDGIYYIASFLQDAFPGVFIDMCQMFWGERPQEFPLETYDYILISCLATMYWSNLDVLEEIKLRKNPTCHIVFGGPHASFAPQEVLQYGDWAILGEGEYPITQLIQTWKPRGPWTRLKTFATWAKTTVWLSTRRRITAPSPTRSTRHSSVPAAVDAFFTPIASLHEATELSLDNLPAEPPLETTRSKTDDSQAPRNPANTIHKTFAR
jgi:hypothetical protein